MKRIVLLTLALISSTLLNVQSPAQADPAVPGTPLVGNFCASGTAITGSGASFASNAHNKVFIPAYNAACGKGSFTYTGGGSGVGKNGALNRTAYYAGTDEPLSADEWAVYNGDLGCDPVSNTTCTPNPNTRQSPLHHIPIAVGAVAVTYNLNSCGIGREAITLTSNQIGLIYSGLITNWSDPVLSTVNPALGGCNRPIKLVVRSDASGTTYAFKDYLSKRNPQFQAYKQNSFNTKWPAEDVFASSLAKGNGNGGVATLVKNNDGAIGYVELSTAVSNGLSWAKVDGPGGPVFGVSPVVNNTGANCDLAAVGATTPPSTLSAGWDAASITDTPNPLAYPICTFTYALIYNNLHQAFPNMSATTAQTLMDYLHVALEDAAQNSLSSYYYAKLPANIQAEAKAGLATVTYL